MVKPITIKDHYREAQLIKLRVVLASVLVVLASILLLSRLAFLQILQYERYTTASEANRIKLQPIPANRGLIFDRNGVLLADNQPSFTLLVHPKKVEDLESTLTLLAALVEFTPVQRKRFQKRLDRGRRPDQGVPVRFDLTESEMARLAVNRHRLLGVEVQAELVRHYPLSELTAHTIGYVGRINDEEEAQIDQAAYAGTQHIGKLGIEWFYESQLLGQVGFQRVETDARGRVSRVLERIDPLPGENLTLFLDVNVQKAAHEALGDRRGAVVAIELPTGGVVAMVSTPSFDNNLFVQGIDHKNYNALNRSLDRPLYNRALKGQYPPGSTIKPMVALAGLERAGMDWHYRIWDPGFYRLPGVSHQYRDWKRRGHGWVDMHRAIVQSCDTYFYELSNRLKIDPMHDFLSLFGLGAPTGIDLGGERPGILPSSQWKRAYRGQPWYPGETLITGIGQGYMLATPLQLAHATAVMATGGQTPRPRLARSAPSKPAWTAADIALGMGKTVEGVSPSAKQAQESAVESGSDVSQGPAAAASQLPWQPENWSRIVEAMRDVVHGPEGTARKLARNASYRMAGKTGTAQVVAIPQGEKYDSDKIDERHRDHGLFIAFAPLENPLIAVAVIVENGESGGSAAGPVARAVMDAYLLGVDP